LISTSACALTTKRPERHVKQMKRPEPIVAILVFAIAVTPMSAIAQEGDAVSPGYKHDIRVSGIGEGAYNIRASVRPTTENVPMGLANKKSSTAQTDREKQVSRTMQRAFLGSATDDVPLFDPMTTAVVNELVDSNGPLVSNPNSNTTTSTPSSAMDPEAHHHQQGPGGPEDHHKLPTDGSPGAEDITNGAINTFYENLPRDVVHRLSGMGVDPLATVHAAGDPYAPFAIAMSRGDFRRMRQMAQDEAITNLRERIAMLGLAGAAALRNMNNSKNNDTFPAKDTLRKVAEDLHYAGKGLDESKPNEAKLKATCEDISRIWSNMTQANAQK